MKAHLLFIFLCSSLSLWAMEQNSLENINVKIAQLKACLNEASASLIINQKAILVPMLAGLLVMLVGGMDAIFEITPYGKSTFATGVGLWAGPLLSLPSTIDLIKIVKRAKDIMSEEGVPAYA